MSKASGAQLLIAHAFRQEGPQEIGYAPAECYEQWRRGVRTAAEEKLEPLVAQARREGVDARSLVLEGSPDETIVETARREGVDLVVVGTHGRRGAERFFLGSVASRVVGTSECPVMTVRATQEGPAAGKTPT